MRFSDRQLDFSVAISLCLAAIKCVRGAGLPHCNCPGTDRRMRPQIAARAICPLPFARSRFNAFELIDLVELVGILGEPMDRCRGACSWSLAATSG